MLMVAFVNGGLGFRPEDPNGETSGREPLRGSGSDGESRRTLPAHAPDGIQSKRDFVP